MLAFIFLMYVYIKILVNTDYTGSNKIIQAISSLLPSLGLGILGYYAKKRLKSFHDQHSKELGPISDQIPVTDTQEDDITLVNDSERTEQSHIEMELEERAIADEDSEATQLLSEQHVVVEIENESSV